MLFYKNKTKNKQSSGTVYSILEGNKVKVCVNRINSMIDLDVSCLCLIAKGCKCMHFSL